MSDQPAGEILLYQRADGAPDLEVRLDGETVWLNQQQLAELFQTSRSNITEHIQNIYAEGELDEAATSREFRQVRSEGGRTVERSIRFYNLDLIISLGYRIKSTVATRFRIWATQHLREYIVQGFAMNDARLKQLGGGSYWRDLLERIRAIRSNEQELVRGLLHLYATSIDYDPRSPATRDFFRTMQNKLHYAAHGRTAAEIIAQRADANRLNMGLTSFRGDRPRKADVSVAKNYLNDQELGRLNALVSAFFDIAEYRARTRQPTAMRDWVALLDQLIAAMNAPVLNGEGTVSPNAAAKKAEAEYAKFRAQLAASPSATERSYLASIERARQKIAA